MFPKSKEFVLILSCFIVFTFNSASPVNGQEFDENDLKKISSNEGLKLTKSDGTEFLFSLPNEGIVVLEWFNPACPFVQKIYKDGFMQNLRSEFISKGVNWFVLNSTNKNHRDFLAIDKRTALLSDWNLNEEIFYYDENSELAYEFKAKTTPHFYIFSDGVEVYNGAIDDSPLTDTNPKEANNYIESTLRSLLEGKSVEPIKNRPYGCSIKFP